MEEIVQRQQNTAKQVTHQKAVPFQKKASPFAKTVIL
jgi:hypothetical protein